MKTHRRDFLAGSLATLGNFMTPASSSTYVSGAMQGEAQIAPFVADVTPPLGEPLVFGLSPPTSVIEHPLLAKGIVLRDSGGTYVLGAVDWTEIHNDSYELFRREIARAARTSPSRVAIHTLHQHTAPAYDTDMQRILNRRQGAPAGKGLEFLEEAVARTAAAVEKATAQWRGLTHVGTSWASVDRVASSRRILQPDGTLLTRLSSTQDPEQQRAPEGYIDGYLRTVTFFDREQPAVRVHYYATHPQSYYGDGRVTYDVPGLARERLEKESGVFQVYFTGCGGDIAMGKYNNGTPARRPELVDRVYDGMVRSMKNVHIEPVSGIRWATIDVRFPVRNDGSFSAEACRKVLDDPKASFQSAWNAASLLALVARAKADRPFQLSCLAIGSVRILHLPGEPFVEYQFWAQRQNPELFVAIAGYGDCGTGYICTDRAYSDRGGYEQTESFIVPSEKLLKDTIRTLLTG
jgi:hypothetical protein